MTVMVTGGGLIAAHAARDIAEAGDDVVIYDIAPSARYLDVVMDGRPYRLERGDILDLAQMLRVAQGCGVDSIVHSAAFLPGRAAAQPAMATRVNVEGTVNVLEVHRLAGMRRFVLCSTIGLYDQTVDGGAPWEEDHPIGPDSFYGVTKMSAEYIALHYAAAYDVDVVALRFCPVFGLGQYYDSGGASVMQTLVEGPAMGRPATLTRRFSNTNQYLYAPDAAAAIVAALGVGAIADRAINISMGELHTVPELIEIVATVIPDARIDIDPEAWTQSKDRHFVTQPFSLARARAVLDFKPAFTMEDAVAHYADRVRLRDGGA